MLTRLLIVTLCVASYPLLTTPSESTADDAMSFSLYREDLRPTFDLIQFVYASGVITANTGEQFTDFVKEHGLTPGGTVEFNSPGGSLFGGMELGEAIRAAGFNTDIAIRKINRSNNSFPKTLPGHCLSACALAFLGGVHRYWTTGSVYGVHRFSTDSHASTDLDTAQIVSGAVVDYITTMGAAATLFSRMTNAGPKDIVLLSVHDLVAMNVVTGRVSHEGWALKSAPGEIYVVGTLVDDRGTSKLMFLCSRDNRKLLSMVYVPFANIAYAKAVVSKTVDAGYFVDDEIHRLISTGRSVSMIADGSKVDALWDVQPSDIAAITSAKTYTGFALLPSTAGIFAGFKMTLGEGRDVIRDYAEQCWK